jgi:hypothetical protein
MEKMNPKKKGALQRTSAVLLLVLTGIFSGIDSAHAEVKSTYPDCPRNYFGQIDLNCDNYSVRYITRATNDGHYLDSCPENLNKFMTLCDPNSPTKGLKAWYRPELKFESAELEFPTKAPCVVNAIDTVTRNVSFARVLKRGAGAGYLMVDWGIPDLDEVRISTNSSKGSWKPLERIFTEVQVVGADPCLDPFFEKSTYVNAWKIPTKQGRYVVTVGSFMGSGANCSVLGGRVTCTYRSRSAIVETLKVEVVVSSKNVVVKKITCLMGTKVFDCDGPGF